MRFYYKLKLFYFIVITFLLIFIINISFFSKNYFDYSNQVLNENLVLDLFVNGELCAYDKNSDTYFYSSKEEKNFRFSFNSLYYLDYFVIDNEYNNYYLYVYNNEYYEKIKVSITSLPIVDIKSLEISSSNSFFDFNNLLLDNLSINNSNSNLVAHFLDPEFDDSYYSDCLMEIRGSSSFWFDKKAYKLSFTENIDVLGLPKDDKYVLDALYVDTSKVRNLLSSDMWNLINDNQTINNDLKGRFVELFDNDEYIGLYVIKEKVDKKMANVGNNGTFVKSIFRSNDNFIEMYKSNNVVINGMNFLNYEIKYFNDESTYKLISMLCDYYSNDQSFESINENFILDNYFNYEVLVSLIGGDDNINYNQYLSLYDKDSKILITPWDMDLTWGINWNDSSDIRSIFTIESSYDTNWMNNNITNKMDYESLNYLKNRYWELRNDVITMDVINNYLDTYKLLLVDSGAGLRDSHKWYNYKVEIEIEKIRLWAENRINFLDQYFK